MECADENAELKTFIDMAEYFAFKNYNDLLHGNCTCTIVHPILYPLIHLLLMC